MNTRESLVEQRAGTPQEYQTAGSERVGSHAQRRLTLGLILMVVSIAFEALAVAATLPVTVRALGDLDLYGWAFSAFMLANLIGITLAGSQADRRGPVQPLVVGVSNFAVGLVIAGSAPSMPILIAGRTLQGFGAGFLYTLAFFTIARGYPEALRPRMLALVSAAWVIPGLVGPALAGLIAEWLGWRWVFFGLVPSAPLAALLVLPALRRMASAGPAAADSKRPWVSASMLALGVGVALHALRTTSLALALVLVGLGGGLTIVALRELLPRGTLRAAPGRPAAVALAGLLHIAFYGVDAFVPLALTAVRGQTAAIAGLALTAGSLGWTAGTVVQARLATRWRRRRLAMLGVSLLMLGLATFAAGLATAAPIVACILAWGLTGLGMGLAYATSVLVVLEDAPAGSEGAATAGVQLANVLGIAVGTGVGGVIVTGMSDGASSLQAGISLQLLVAGAVVAVALIPARRLPNQAV